MNSTPETFNQLYQIESQPSIHENSKPEELINWAFSHFADRKIVLTTSFGMEGCALIDMCSKVADSVKVAYIDTGFFFPETLKLRDQIAEKYDNVELERWASPVTVEKQKESYGPNLWQNNPTLCCHIRKVVPMIQHIGQFDLWITGIRKSQTAHRAQTPTLQWDWRYKILKFSPLANWTRKDTWKYVNRHDVPFNQLHLQGFPSISCFYCTKAVPNSSPDSDNREGRWEGTDKTECGLHYSI